MRVSVHKQKPIARGGGRAAITRPSNLVHRLEGDLRAGCSGQFRGAIRRVVITDDEFCNPALLFHDFQALVDTAQRLANETLFVEGRNDDGKFQVSRLFLPDIIGWGRSVCKSLWEDGSEIVKTL